MNLPQKLSDSDLQFLKSVGVVQDDDLKQCQIGPKKYYLPGSIPQYLKEIREFPIWDGDVWVVTLPRSGTTLTQEMVWQICNNLDLETGCTVPLVDRFPFFEFPCLAPVDQMLENHKNNPQILEKVRFATTLPWKKQYDPKVPRFLKTHLPLSIMPPELLTKNCKVVYVARSLGDVLVSNYHHRKMLGEPVPEKFEDFWTIAQKGLMYGYPYFEHILEAWNLREHKNVLFLFYEDIVKKPHETIAKVAKFMGKNYSEEQINQLADHLKVENFKKQKSLSVSYGEILSVKNNQHVRNGKVGSWKEEFFTEELRQKVTKWVDEQLKTTDLKFPVN